MERVDNLPKDVLESLSPQSFLDAQPHSSSLNFELFSQQLEYWIELGLIPTEIPRIVQNYQTQKAFWKRLILACTFQQAEDESDLVNVDKKVGQSEFFKLLNQIPWLGETAEIFVFSKRQKNKKKGVETALAEEAGRFSLQQSEVQQQNLKISPVNYYTLKQTGGWEKTLSNQLAIVSQGAQAKITPEQRVRTSDKTLCCLGNFLVTLGTLDFKEAESSFLKVAPSSFTEADFLKYLVMNAELEVFCPNIARYAQKLIKGSADPEIKISPAKSIYFRGTLFKVLFDALQKMTQINQVIGDAKEAKRSNYDKRLTQTLAFSRISKFTEDPKKYKTKSRTAGNQKVWEKIENIQLQTPLNIINQLSEEEIETIAFERIRAIAHSNKIKTETEIPLQAEFKFS